MNNKERKAKILSAIEGARNQGFTLVYGEWGNVDMQCACALGCVLLSENKEPDLDEVAQASRALSVSDAWVNSFIEGFDGIGTMSGAVEPEAWKMGHDIRNQTEPEDFTDFLEKN